MKSRIDGDIYIFFKTAFTKGISNILQVTSNSISGILPFTSIGPSPHGDRQTATAMQQSRILPQVSLAPGNGANQPSHAGHQRLLFMGSKLPESILPQN